MKRAHWLYVAAFSLMTTPAFAEMTGNINAFLGQKTLDSNDWSPLDEQLEIGALFDIRDTRWPISIAADLLASADEVTIGGVDVTGSTVELDLGVRKVFDISGNSLHPYVGGGLAIVTAELDGVNDDHDTGTGYWVSGGAFWTFSNHINVGMDVRYSQADVTLFNTTVEAGGTHVGAMVGYQW